MYRVTVTSHDGQSVVFLFNRLVDALNFSETCLECGDNVMISIREQKEEN